MYLSFRDVQIRSSNREFKSVYTMFKCYYASYEVLHSYIIKFAKLDHGTDNFHQTCQHNATKEGCSQSLGVNSRLHYSGINQKTVVAAYLRPSATCNAILCWRVLVRLALSCCSKRSKEPLEANSITNIRGRIPAASKEIRLGWWRWQSTTNSYKGQEYCESRITKDRAPALLQLFNSLTSFPRVTGLLQMLPCSLNLLKEILTISPQKS